jgi:thiamine phosphate synthase YjbQ (UPF0047 family)
MIVTEKISVGTHGRTDIVDITGQIAVSGITNGTATIFISGSTAGITTIEYESGLVDH